MAHSGFACLDHQARLGATTNAAETAIEATGLAPTATWLALQPDFQYGIYPTTSDLYEAGGPFRLRFEARSKLTGPCLEPRTMLRALTQDLVGLRLEVGVVDFRGRCSTIQ